MYYIDSNDEVRAYVLDKAIYIRVSKTSEDKYDIFVLFAGMAQETKIEQISLKELEIRKGKYIIPEDKIIEKLLIEAIASSSDRDELIDVFCERLEHYWENEASGEFADRRIRKWLEDNYDHMKEQCSEHGSGIIELIPGMNADCIIENINETGKFTARNTGTVIEYMIDEI